MIEIQLRKSCQFVLVHCGGTVIVSRFCVVVFSLSSPNSVQIQSGLGNDPAVSVTYHIVANNPVNNQTPDKEMGKKSQLQLEHGIPVP